MAQQLMALAALQEDSGLIPSTFTVTPVPGDQTPSSGFYWYCTHVVYRHRGRQNIYLHTMKNKS